MVVSIKVHIKMV